MFEEDIMRCKDCEYPAEDIYDLGEYMHEFHGENIKNKFIAGKKVSQQKETLS